MDAKFKMADFVWMCRCIQGETVYMYEDFGGDGALHVEVIRTWCLTGKENNGVSRHAHQVWHSWKISVTFVLQGIKMILSECEDCGV